MDKHVAEEDFQPDMENITQFQQTFDTASEAAGDQARGSKRKGDAIVNEEPKKKLKVAFVNSGEGSSQDDKEDVLGAELKEPKSSDKDPFPIPELKASSSPKASTSKEPIAGCSKDVAENVNEIVTEPEKIDYMEELSHVKCVAATYIANHMFDTKYGKLVLLVRTRQSKLGNIQESCRLCHVRYEHRYETVANVWTVIIKDKIVAEASEATKKLGKKVVENLAWEVLVNEAITILVKEQFISQDDARSDFPEAGQPGPRDDEFGAPVEASVAARMMTMMQGTNSKGFAEPIHSQMQLVNRAGLGSATANIRQIKDAAVSLMKRYCASDCIYVDLIFGGDFTKAERTAIHYEAMKNRLISRCYGKGTPERFLLVRKKIDIFNLALTIVENGGSTPKYKIFIPTKAASLYKERD